MKVFLLTCLFFLFAIYSKAQIESEQTLLDKLANAESDSLKAETYISLHNIVFITDLNKARNYASKVLETGLKTGSLKYIQKGYYELARCARKRRDYDSVMPYDFQVLRYVKKAINAENLFLAYLQIARDYTDAPKLKEALPYLDTCAQMVSSLNNPALSAKLNQSYAWYYDNMNQSKIALPYYKKALQTYLAINDEKMIPEAEYALGYCFLNIREPDSASIYLYQALERYKKRGSIGRQADCYGFLGQCYVLNGNTDKGIELYLKDVELEKASFDSAALSLSYIDLGRAFLINKDTFSALQYAHESEAILCLLNLPYGNTTITTFWGQYYSAIKQFDKAESYFKQANILAVKNNFSDLTIENEKYWAQLRYKEKKNAGADSLVYSYSKQMLASKEPSTINRELNTLLKRNPQLDSSTVATIKLLYSPGGADFLRKKLGIQSLTAISDIDSVINLNPFSLAPFSHDSSVVVSDDKQMLELSTKYQTKLLSDSLKIETKNAEVIKEEVQRRNITLAAISIIALLLAGGFFLQYKNRRRAVADKEKIQTLQNEIHHRIENNLAVLRQLITVSGESNGAAPSVDTLQSRISAIELLHSRIYHDNLIGNIFLQKYLSELTQAIADVYKTEKAITVSVNAPVEISSRAAEIVGLIVNEVVANSYKYAFDKQETGRIKTDAVAIADNYYKLSISDNGNGFTSTKKDGYGMKLIAGLSQELNGKFSFENNNGTLFTLYFTDVK